MTSLLLIERDLTSEENRPRTPVRELEIAFDYNEWEGYNTDDIAPLCAALRKLPCLSKVKF
jgi:hypothetical protein